MKPVMKLIFKQKSFLTLFAAYKGHFRLYAYFY